MSLAMAHETALPASPHLTRGWLSEVSAITGSVLPQPLLVTAEQLDDGALARCRSEFLAWLLVGDDGKSGAQIGETVHLSRSQFPLIAHLVREKQPVAGVLKTHLQLIEERLGQRQIATELQREALRKSDTSIEEAHGAIVELCREYASICALEVAEGVIGAQMSWEGGNFQGSGHTLAEAILAYTSTQAFWAAVAFWTSANLDQCYVQIYSDTYQTKLAKHRGERAVRHTLEAHEEALDCVRTVARREAGLRIEGFLRE